MAAESNNGDNNIKWLFVVVLQSVCCFIFGSYLGTWVWVGCFYQVVGHRVSSCIQLVLLCWCFPGDILSFRSGSVLGQFQWLFLTIIYNYIFIVIHFCLIFVTRFGFLQLPHTYTTIVSGFLFLDLVDMLLPPNLPCINLLSFALEIFSSTRFQPFV